MGEILQHVLAQRDRLQEICISIIRVDVALGLAFI